MKRFKEIFVDFDDTLTESLKSFCDIYNTRYVKDINWKNIKAWDCKDQCPELQKGELLDIFSSEQFFRNLKVKTFAKEALENLSCDYPITIISIGTHDNCSKKARYIKSHFPFVSKTILIASNKKDKLTMDKSFINMKNGIFIDDVEKNLISSNAKKKVLFETISDTDWNRNWRGEKIKNWEEIYKYF
jgi:5'(3')-deoxyribonucleotidase